MLPITELQFVAIEDAGVPNRERIVLRVATQINLAEFAVILGWQKQGETSIYPRNDMFFWLGNRVVSPSAWIVLVTGQGKDQIGKHTDGNDVHWFYWGRDQTIFVASSVPAEWRPAAALIRLGGVEIRVPR